MKKICKSHDWDNYGKCTNCGVWDVDGTRFDGESPEEHSNRRQKEVFGINDLELHEAHTRATFWRGFRACLILVVVPIVLTIIVLAHVWVNANI